MNLHRVFANCLFLFSAPLLHAAPLPISTTMPSDPTGYYQINLQGFDIFGGSRGGAFWLRGSSYNSAHDHPTYQPLAGGSASLWVQGPVMFGQDVVHLLTDIDGLPDLNSYYSSFGPKTVYMTMYTDHRAPLDLTGSTELTVTINSYVLEKQQFSRTYYLFGDVTYTANNGNTAQKTWGTVLSIVPEPSGMSLFVVGALLCGALLRGVEKTPDRLCRKPPRATGSGRVRWRRVPLACRQ